MEGIATVGLDLAKNTFQVHAVNAVGEVIVRRALRRSQVLAFFERLPPCLVGMEACGSAHYWAREIGAMGHTVRLMPAAYVKAYVKRNKTDAADAEAICEAVTRPTMRYVAVKGRQEQAAAIILRTRDLLTRQRTQSINALRGHMAELGVIAAAGAKSCGKLIAIVRDDADDRLPAMAREALAEIADQIESLNEKIAALERKIVATVRQDEVARRLTAIPGVGPITAATVRAAVAPSRRLSERQGLRCLDRPDTKVQLERRQGETRFDLETRKSSAPLALGRRCNGNPEAFAEWLWNAAVGDRPSAAARSGRYAVAGECGMSQALTMQA